LLVEERIFACLVERDTEVVYVRLPLEATPK